MIVSTTALAKYVHSQSDSVLLLLAFRRILAVQNDATANYFIQGSSVLNITITYNCTSNFSRLHFAQGIQLRQRAYDHSFLM